MFDSERTFEPVDSADARGRSDPSDLSDLPLELIERRLSELAAQINAGSCRMLEYVAEFDRRQGWADTGCLTTSDWLAWRCALSPRAAREHVRIARRLEDLPRIHAAFAAGELSYSKVRSLTRVASGESEQDLLELARHATAAQLGRMLGAYRRVSTDEARMVAERAYLGYCWEDDGSLSIRARLAPEHGAAFLSALDASRDAIADGREADEAVGGSAGPRATPDVEATSETHDGPAEPPPEPRAPISNVEAFGVLIEAACLADPLIAQPRDRYVVNVHVEAAMLAGAEATEGGPARCELSGGPPISAETARKLACDAPLVRILESEGQILSVGRKTRAIPPAMRRALVARDRTCRFPGCERRRFLEAHHLQHWALGGETSMENVAMFCGSHHDLHHEGGFTVAGNANRELTFRSRYGWTLSPSPPLGPATPRDLEHSNARAGTQIGPNTIYAGSGEPMDLGACVDAVIAATRPDRGG